MKWLCQLKDGFMLGINKGYVNKVETGYPYPDIEGGQISAISGYFEMEEVDLYSFVNKAIILDYPMSETKFKNTFYPDRFKMEKSSNATIMDLGNELNKLKKKEVESTNPLISFNGKTINVNSIDDINILRGLFAISESYYKASESDLAILQGCSFNYKKSNKVVYLSGLSDDIKKLQGLIDRCYEGIDYEYHIDHETSVCASFEKDMFVLNVDSDNSLLVFGFDIRSEKIYEFITSIEDDTISCKSFEGHKVIRSENSNIVLEFDSYVAYKLNAGNGNWEICKNKL